MPDKPGDKTSAMKPMNDDERVAYEWALDQSYPSVAARYARILANYILRNRDNHA